MLRHVVSLAFVASALAGCKSYGNATGPSNQFGAGTVAISVDRSAYSWDEASVDGIRGTIRNTSDRDIYSGVGDAFNGSMEQDLLLISGFSDGAVERETGASQWTRVETAVAIEGTRFVVLRPGKAYRFIAQVAGAPHAGTHRIGLTYRSTIADEERATVGTSYSASFVIR